MYLFYRSARMGAGDIREQMSWATKVTEKVNQISETPVTLWTSVFSPGQGTLVWTTMVEHLHTLESNFDKLLADEGYLDLVAQAAKWESSSPIDDGLIQYLTTPEEREQPPAYSTVVTATLAPGSFTHGVEVGLEIAQRAQKITGIPVQFAIATTGAYGEIGWLAGYDSIEQLEQGQQALNGDPTFAAYLDAEAKNSYLPGSAKQIAYRRIV